MDGYLRKTERSTGYFRDGSLPAQSYGAVISSKKQYHFVAIIPSFTQGEYWEAISEGIDKVAAEMETYNITITKLFFDQYNNKTFDDITRIYWMRRWMGC